jgi:CheY-like chemotaxis protein
MAKILLVEDDNNLREIYEARLQAEGYEIVSANDGESALVVAKSEKPDLVISDVMMPKISGFEMLDILRNTDELRDVKVIMLTALGQADDQARANKLGADRYLVKSQVTLEDIVKVSHELLDGGDGSATAPAGAAPAEPAATPAPAADPSPAGGDSATPTPIAVTAPPDEPMATDPPVAAAPAADPAAQTSATEEATVEKQIEDFVATQPTDAPVAVEPSATPEAPTQPEVTSPETTPSAAQVSDDKVLSNAVDTLVADANEASEAQSAPAPAVEATEPATPAEPTPPPAEAAPATTSDNVAIAHKKIIQPLDSTNDTPDLNALLAVEEAKEAEAAAAAPPQPVVSSNEDEAPSGAPTPPPSSQAEHAGPDKPLDPNSIAL